ncbi:DNA methyltransferase, partial [Helicobacter typhlonius]
SIESIWKNLKIERDKDGIISIKKPIVEVRFKTIWDESTYIAGDYGSKILTNILPNNEFDYPKSIHTVKDSIYLASKEDSVILDFFGGSGTTAHAVLELNREGTNRKFVLVEQGEHFYNVILPRIKKVAFSSEWKNGKLKDDKQVKPLNIAFRYYELESYEEALSHCEYVLECKEPQKVENKNNYKGKDYAKAESILDYRKSRKLIDKLHKGESVCLDMHTEYREEFDIFHTMANLMGWKIKRLFLDSKGIESCEFDNGEILNLDSIDLAKYPKLKNLIWWE